MTTQFRNCGEDISSAKGAMFISHPGTTSPDRRDRTSTALKAHFTSGTSLLDRDVELTRAYSVDCYCNSTSGALPDGDVDVAPVELHLR